MIERYPTWVITIGSVAIAVASHQQPTFRTGVKPVSIYATVVDHAGHLVTDLRRDDFYIRDNGRPVDITLFDNRPMPITAVVLMDVGFFLHEQFARSRDGLGGLVASLHSNDRLAIGSFGRETALSPLLTGDKAVLLRVLSEELWPVQGGGYPWRACALAIRTLEREQGRRVLVLVSDGLTVLPSVGSAPAEAVRGEYNRIADALRRRNYVLYAVVFPGFLGAGSHLRDLTEETGGGHVEIRQNDDVKATFARIADELRHQYVIGFEPSALDGATHQLDVAVSKPGLKVRARRTYVAVP